MKKISMLAWACFLPITTFSLTLGDTDDTMTYRITNALISSANTATSFITACTHKYYTTFNQLPRENFCKVKATETLPFYSANRSDGCTILTYKNSGIPRLLAGKIILTCPLVDARTGEIVSFSSLTTYTNVGDNHSTNSGNLPFQFSQTSFAQATAMLGSDFSGAKFVPTSTLSNSVQELQASNTAYEESHPMSSGSGSSSGQNTGITG